MKRKNNTETHHRCCYRFYRSIWRHRQRKIIYIKMLFLSWPPFHTIFESFLWRLHHFCPPVYLHSLFTHPNIVVDITIGPMCNANEQTGVGERGSEAMQTKHPKKITIYTQNWTITKKNNIQPFDLMRLPNWIPCYGSWTRTIENAYSPRTFVLYCPERSFSLYLDFFYFVFDVVFITSAFTLKWPIENGCKKKKLSQHVITNKIGLKNA